MFHVEHLSYTCQYHGELAEASIYPRKLKGGRIRPECNICRFESAYRQRSAPEYKAKKYALKQRSIVGMVDAYVKDRLVQGGFVRSDITPEIIELKRVMITLSRIIRGIKRGDIQQDKQPNRPTKSCVNDNTKA